MRQARVHILDVGHGDTIILEIPVKQSEKVYGVIDCIKFDDVTLPYLEELGVNELAFVCSTHPHLDHIGDVQKLLEYYTGKVGEYWDSGKEHTSDTYMDLTEYVWDNDIPTEFVRSGSRVRFGRTNLHIFSPPTKLFLDEKESYNINNASIVIMVEHGLSKILLGGDAQFANWANVRVNHRDFLKAHALKLSHHGSKHGNFLECFEAIKPNYAIISAGTRDLTKFPHQSTIDALHEIMDPNRIFITRDRGDIIITSNGSTTLDITPER